MSSRRALGPIAIAAGALLMSACAQDYSVKAGHIDSADFGEANRQTFAAMIIDPEPKYTEPLATSGEHATAAITRYANDQIKEPVSATLTSGSGSSGASSGSSGK